MAREAGRKESATEQLLPNNNGIANNTPIHTNQKKGEGHVNKKLPTWVTIPAVCVASALMLNGVNGATRAKIDRHASMADDLARAKLVNAEKFEPLELQDSRYSVDEVYAALNGAGETVGYVGKTTVTGYGGPVEVTAGVDGEGVITGVDVGSEGFNETPGLGGLTREPKFVSQFKGKAAGVKLNEGEDTDGVDGVAGATISSRAVLGGVNNIASYVASAELGILEEAEEAYMGPTVSASAKGFAGDVTVTAGLDDAGAVAYLAVETPDETEGLGKLASEPEFTRQFIGKTGPFTYGEDGIEAVSGATSTSTAAINAINAVVSGGGQSGDSGAVTVQGFGGDVTLHAELNEDGTVASLTIDTPNETDGLGKRASEEAFTAQFIGKAGPFTYGEDGIEALTGATVTSTAVLAGLNSLYAQEPAAEAPVEEPAAEEPVEEEAPAEAAEAGALADGTYTASKDTGFSVIDVTLTVAGGKIAESKVESSGANDLLTDDQRSAWSTQIVDTQGAEVDAVTGVTISSNAVKEAVEELLAQAAAGEAAEAPVEETEEEEAPAEAAEAGALADGTYAVDKATAFSNIHVEMSVEGGVITASTVSSEAIEGSMDLLTDDQRSAWSTQIVDTQGAEVDAVTGVTISSNAVKEAVEELLAQAAAGEAAELEPAA